MSMAETTPSPRDGTAAARVAAPAAMPSAVAPPPRPANDRRTRLWAQLHDEATGQADYFQAWLALQCEEIPGTAGGLLLLRTAEGPTQQQAIWPPHLALGGRDPADLARLAERALSEQRTVIAWGRREAGAAAPVILFVAQPLGPDAAPHAAVALAVAVPGGMDRADPEGIARRLRAASGWLETWRWRQPLAAAGTRLAIAAAGLDILAATGEHKGLTASAMALVNALATRLACDRVSLGLARPTGTRLRAISHAAEFTQGSRIADAIEDAMEEALAQGATIAFPPPAEGAGGTSSRRIAAAHRELAAAAGGHAVLASVLLPGPGGRPAGVLTLERHRDAPFSPEELQLAETVATLTGPLIGLHAEEHRWLSGRLRNAAATALTALFGPARPALKLATALALALLATLAVAQGNYRVTARSVLEGEIQRAAVAPFDGYIRTAPKRAGDTVRAGETLATLDDRDLILDRQKFLAEREKLTQKYREALAKSERATMAVLAAQLAQAQAELSLAEEKLARARIAAPFDAIVVSGDLRQMLGSPIERGKVLFELAPLDAFRLVLQADEPEIRWLAPGQHGLLALAAAPSQRLPVTITRITPVATAEDGRNFFRVEARLDTPSPVPLRPGMEGVAKIEAGEASLLWIWTHAIIDWVRLFLWQWLP